MSKLQVIKEYQKIRLEELKQLTERLLNTYTYLMSCEQLDTDDFISNEELIDLMGYYFSTLLFHLHKLPKLNIEYNNKLWINGERAEEELKIMKDKTRQYRNWIEREIY